MKAVVLLGTVIGFGLLACNPREPGCLDLAAENFDVTAEKHDPAMCIYPDLILNVLYEWGDTSFAPGNIYENDQGEVFTIESFYLLLSQFVLTTAAGVRETVDDRIDWYLAGTGQTVPVPDDFVLADRSRFNYVLGATRTTGLLERLQFSLGIPDTLTPTVPDSLSAGHPLRSARVIFDADAGTVSAGRFVLNRDTSQQVLDTLVVFTEPHAYDYPFFKQFVQGRDDTIRIAVDLKQLFGDLSLARPADEIVSDLSGRLSTAVRDNN
ncbi:MAG: hypothetical protein R3301_01895 [Saprospiraceae bacterium]|nr:hypothetical protein [Saprospiraceae bacterium]